MNTSATRPAGESSSPVSVCLPVDDRRNLVGREAGMAARRALNLDGIQGHVVIKVPEAIMSITSSYILGLFGPELRSMPDLDSFLRRYSIQVESTDCAHHILLAFIRGAQRGLMERAPVQSSLESGKAA